MGIVNVDSSLLIGTATQIKSAISSIDETKAKLNRRHQQIGQFWKDKKFNELTHVVSDCITALNSIQKTLVAAQKFIGQLSKSIIEYESVELGNIGASSEHGETAYQAVSRAYSAYSELMGIQKTDAEKMMDFKTGLAAIDERMVNYSESLVARGLSNGVIMSAILSHQRTVEEAELLRNINGDFSDPVSPPDFDQIIANVTNQGLLNYQQAETSPRNLQETRYGFSTQTINGNEMRVYNDPVGTGSLLIQRQGNSHYDMSGTCGLCQCSNILTMSGVQGSSEDSIISAAMHSSDSVLDCLDLFSDNSGERGGTTAAGRQEILARCGVPTYTLPISFNRTRTTQQLSEAVRTGHGVIVSVDVAHLWRNGQRGGHAISLISVTEDGETFIYSDTGSGRIATISASDLAHALTGRPANITTNIIR